MTQVIKPTIADEPSLPTHREDLERTLVGGIACFIGEDPARAKAIADGIKTLLDGLDPAMTQPAPIMADGSAADPEKFGIAAIEGTISENLATKARNAAIVGGSNLGQDKPMLYEDQIPKVATNAEILAAIRARHAAAMRGEKVEYRTTEPAIVRMESKTYPDGTIQAKASKAPRVTPAALQAEIVSAHFFTAYQGAKAELQSDGVAANAYEEIGMQPLKLLTFCVLVLRNGFTVHGVSACASPENYNEEIGRRIAHEKAVQEIWPLLGFRLRDELSRPVLTEADAAADLAGIPRPGSSLR